MKHLHFIGAGGIGVSALAAISLHRGQQVSGCDRNDNNQTAMLRQLGAEIFIGHSPNHVKESDEVIYTSAMNLGHPELLAAGKRKRRRGEFLAEIMGKNSVGICGTHGKTTTTWMVSHMLIECGFDPTVLVGGEVKALSGNFRAGSELFVSELDESDGTFLLPDLAVGAITNIESEHLAYYRTLEEVVKSFTEFSDKHDRHLSLNLDCPYCFNIYQQRNAPKVGFGLRNREGYHLRNLCANGRVQKARVFLAEKELGELVLPFSGEHNLYNALCAVSVVLALGADVKKALEALSECCTVGRRMEFLGEFRGVDFYSDYAHHPTEVMAAINGAREFTEGELLVIFQPHLYSRTRDYAVDFAAALAGSDNVLLLDIYPAREEPIAGVDSHLISRRLVDCGCRVNGPVELAMLEPQLRKILEKTDSISTVIFMGAGDIDAAGRDFVLALEDKCVL